MEQCAPVAFPAGFGGLVNLLVHDAIVSSCDDLECLCDGLRYRLAMSPERFEVSSDGFLNQGLNFFDSVAASVTARQVRDVGAETSVIRLLNDDDVLHKNTSFQPGLLQNAAQRAGKCSDLTSRARQ